MDTHGKRSSMFLNELTKNFVRNYTNMKTLRIV